MIRQTVCALAVVTAAGAQEFARPDVVLGVPMGDFRIGDSNGDGLADAYVNGTAGRYVAFGLVGGGFSQTVPAHVLGAIPATARVEAFADVTGDGRDDLVLMTTGEAEVLVAPALEDGTFAAVISTPLATNIGALVAIDVDGDGRDDLWVGEALGSRATLLTANGDGSFTPGMQVQVPPRPVELAFADVTGDGRRDLVSLSRGSSSLETIPAVAIGTATGLAKAVPLVEPSAPVQKLRLGDANGDGIADVGLLSVDSIFAPADQPLAFTYAGGSDLLEVSPLTLPGDRADAWDLADINGDGFADFVALDSFFARVLVRIAQGDGTFGQLETCGAGAFPLARLAIVDADNDGALDLITGSARGTLRVSRGSGAGDTLPSIAALSPSFSSTVRAGDIDDDGLTDVIAVTSLIEGATFELRRGLFGSGFAPPERFTTSRPVEDFALVDVDLDGDLDVLAWLGVIGVNSGVATVFNDGGVFGDAVEQFLDTNHRVPAFGDVTDDGFADVTAFPFTASGDVLRLEGHGDGTFTVVAVGPALNAMVVSGIANVDDVAPLDVVALGPIAFGAPAVVVVTGAGIAAAGAAVDIDPNSLAVGDLNGDGITDTVAGRNGPGFEIRLGDGSGFYDVSGFITDTMAVAGMALVDVDDDGDLDVVAAERGDPSEGDLGRVSTWINDGDAEFEPGDVTVLELSALDVAVMDLDDDGLLDALVTSPTEVVTLSNAAATWTQLGQSLAGPSGFSRLDGVGPLKSGGEVLLSVRGAAPSTATSLVVGFSEVSASVLGGVLVPSPDVIVGGLVTDAFGELEIPATLPAGVPADVSIFLQAWQVGTGGAAATTAVVGVTR